MTMNVPACVMTKVGAILSMVALTGCHDATISSCEVLGQHVPRSEIGMSVLVDTAIKCPLTIAPGSPGKVVLFSATLLMNELYVPEVDPQVYHQHKNRQGSVMNTAVSPWVPSAAGQAESSVSRLIVVGTGGFPPIPNPNDPPEDQWHVQTFVRNNDLSSFYSVVRLTYQASLSVLVGRDPDVPPANATVTLTATPYATDIAPVTWWWYRDGMYIGAHGPTLSVVTGPPGTSAAYLAVGTDATGRQISGMVIVTPDQPLCGSTPNCNDH